MERLIVMIMMMVAGTADGKSVDKSWFVWLVGSFSLLGFGEREKKAINLLLH